MQLTVALFTSSAVYFDYFVQQGKLPLIGYIQSFFESCHTNFDRNLQISVNIKTARSCILYFQNPPTVTDISLSFEINNKTSHRKFSFTVFGLECNTCKTSFHFHLS